VLAVVPSRRRAANVARTVAAAGSGAFFYVGLAHDLEGGRALEAPVWSAAVLAACPLAKADSSLASAVQAVAGTASATPIRPDGDLGRISQGIP